MYPSPKNNETKTSEFESVETWYKKVKVMLKVLRLEMSTAREGDLKCEEGWTPSHQTGVNK